MNSENVWVEQNIIDYHHQTPDSILEPWITQVPPRVGGGDKDRAHAE